MRALIADDDRATALILQRSLETWGIETVVASDGEEAWAKLQADPSIGLGMFDWMMPHVEGPELCRRIRAHASHDHMYLLLVTNRDSRADLVDGLDAGADDYIVKPFNREELRARVSVGARVLKLQQTLADRARDLLAAESSLTRLRKLIPICSYCKKIRGDEDSWEQLETYLSEQTDLELSHGVCPACYSKAVREMSGDE